MGESHERNTNAYLVLGATGSVGSALCRHFADRGQRIVAAGRNAERLSELAAEFDCPTVTVDAHDLATIDHAFDVAIESFGQIAGVANCIGSLLLKPAHRVSDREWQDTIVTNLTSSFAVIRAAAERMRNHGGSLVLMSSAAARIGLAHHEAIAAAKAGIIGLTLSAAASYASRGIRINAIAPGLVRSQMTKNLWETAAAAQTSAAMHPLGRLGEPAEIAETIAWLLGPQASWVTGQVIGVDGGLATIMPRPRARP